VEGCGGSQEDYQLESLSAVEGNGSASALLHEYVTMSPIPSLIKLPNRHHKEEHVATFLPGVKPRGCEYSAAKERRGLNQITIYYSQVINKT
jgi:hypothetical protein